MRLTDFDYDLPHELIATRPAERRDRSRLMVLPRDGSPPRDAEFRDLPALIRPGDCLVLNDSRVIPARLPVRLPTGGRAELLLLAPGDENTWEAMVKPARKLTAGVRLNLPDDAGTAEIVAETGPRTRRIRFDLPGGIAPYLERHGAMPLPPYILQERKRRGEPTDDDDRARYQTVYAQTDDSMNGSVAAPTAGLHFTPELLKTLTDNGVEIRRLTLHVGLGTFEPIVADDPAQHRMHAETYAIDAATADAIEAARIDPDRRVVAVGTTTVRTLETVVRRHGRIRADAGRTDIFIHPGFDFRATQALVTNFHLPRSTLLMLVCAFAGHDRLLAAYRDAIARQYRFFSYGDAMWIG
jgi:S-adenosylmethionine:tRNA ribosyltransferase-isomerase